MPVSSSSSTSDLGPTISLGAPVHLAMLPATWEGQGENRLNTCKPMTWPGPGLRLCVFYLRVAENGARIWWVYLPS